MRLPEAGSLPLQNRSVTIGEVLEPIPSCQSAVIYVVGAPVAIVSFPGPATTVPPPSVKIRSFPLLPTTVPGAQVTIKSPCCPVAVPVLASLTAVAKSV